MIKAKPLFLFSRRSTPYWDADDKALNRGKRREEPEPPQAERALREEEIYLTAA